MESLVSCTWFSDLVRFGCQRFRVDEARATRAFGLRLKMAGLEGRRVDVFADPVACCRAAGALALAEMVDRAPRYAGVVATDVRRDVTKGSRLPPSERELIAAADKAVRRAFFVDARFHDLGPPYEAVADERGIGARFLWRHRDHNDPVERSVHDPIAARARTLARRLSHASAAAFEPLRPILSADRSDEPNAAWRRAWDAGWWPAWDAPAAAPARHEADDGVVAIGEARAAEAGAVACEAACRSAWLSAGDFAETAVVRSLEFAAPRAIEVAVSHVLARRAGLDLRDDDIAYAATFVEPALAGVFLSFMTPLAILCAPWP